MRSRLVSLGNDPSARVSSVVQASQANERKSAEVRARIHRALVAEIAERIQASQHMKHLAHSPEHTNPR